MTEGTLYPWNGQKRTGNWGKMILISLGLHALALSLLLEFIPQSSRFKDLGSAYTVDLVSLPGDGPRDQGPAGPAPEPPKGREESVPIPEPRPAKPESRAEKTALPKPEPRTEKTVLPKPELEEKENEKALQQALERLKNQVQKEKSLDRTLSRLEDRVKGEQALNKALAGLERKKRERAGSGSGAGEGGGQISSATAGGGRDGLGMGVRFQIYHAEIRNRIKRNWLLPEGLLKREDISAEVMIRIGRSGRIEETRFERKSGQPVFDQEVLRALKKSDPLPPLPDKFPAGSYEVVLTFHSRELMGN